MLPVYMFKIPALILAQNIEAKKYDKVTIATPNKKAMTFKYKDPKNYLDKNNHLTEIEHDSELEKDALAFVLSLDYIYNKKLYNTSKDIYAKSTKL